MDRECLMLANCHQIMVDVGKQGKSVNFERLKFFKDILKKLENQPSHKNRDDLILKNLVGKIDIKDKIHKYFEKDYECNVK